MNQEMQAQQMCSLGDRPLIVLSAGKIPSGLPPEFTPSVIDRMIQVGRELDRESANRTNFTLSSNV